MDVFSLGAVIAELFLEDMLFEYSTLLAYKNGQSSFVKDMLSKIKDDKLEKILLQMMNLNPDERIDLNTCKEYFENEICPIAFPTCLLYINKLIVSTDYWKPDKRIGLIYKHWNQIWKLLYGVNTTNIPQLSNNFNDCVMNEIILDKSFENNFIGDKPVIINPEDDNELLIEDYDNNILKANNNSDSSLLFINYILSGILNTEYPSTKIIAMEQLRHFCTKITDITKIQLIIPYLVNLLKDNSTLVQCSALNEIITILYMIREDLILPSSEYNFFDKYVFPAIHELFKTSEDTTVILGVANIIDKLTELELKFLQMAMRSKFNNMRHQTNYSTEIMRQTFVFNISSNTPINNINRGEEIIRAYDTDMAEFKKEFLIKIIEDILSKQKYEDLHIQQTLIRKLAYMKTIFGRSETNNFNMFIIAQFNKNNWIIHREIVKCIPSLVISLSEDALQQILLCLESLIAGSLNELKIYELINTLHILFKSEFLDIQVAVEFFKKILPYILHPNLHIREEVISFASSLIEKLSQGEVFAYLRPHLKKYLSMPFLVISKDLLKKSAKERLSRVIYELEKYDCKYLFSKNEEDYESFDILANILKLGRNFMNAQRSDSGNNSLENILVRSKANLDSMDGINVSYLVRKEFKKLSKLHINYDDLKFLEQWFLGKFVSLSLNTSNLTDKRSAINFISGSSMDSTSQKVFLKLEVLLKALEIVIKDYNLDDEVEIKKSSSMKIPSLQTWKPQGKLLSTIYEHLHSSNSSSVEKLINLNDNKLLSFGSDGLVLLWDLYQTDGDICIDKVSSLQTKENINKPIISQIDNSRFVLARQDGLDVYKVIFA
jgi:hypothetical protein